MVAPVFTIWNHDRGLLHDDPEGAGPEDANRLFDAEGRIWCNAPDGEAVTMKRGPPARIPASSLVALALLRAALCAYALSPVPDCRSKYDPLAPAMRSASSGCFAQAGGKVHVLPTTKLA